MIQRAVVVLFLFVASVGLAEESKDIRPAGKYEEISARGTRYVVVRTPAPNNPTVRVYYHVPASYDPELKRKWRVLVYFGGRNCTGENEAGRALSFGKWGDEHGVFIVAPGFVNDDYWEPAAWSGKALDDALKLMAKMYNIKTNRLLFYGYSAGSQCANLFPADKPKRAVAWVSHACGVFHPPSKAMRNSPGLVTCGDADVHRYVLSRRFVREYRQMGINVIFKSFPNHPHDVPTGSVELAKAFLLYHHVQNLDDLKLENPELPTEKVAFIGDDVDGVYYAPDAYEVGRIAPEDRVILSNREIAEAWGEFRESLWPVTLAGK